MKRPVITGVGAVTAAGIGFQPFADALASAESLAAPITHFDASTFPARIAAEVAELKAKEWIARRKDIKLLSRDSLLAVGAVKDLLGDTTLDDDPYRIGLFFGVGLEEGDPRELAATLAASLDGDTVDEQRLATDGMDQMNPLASLKTLPNMALGHVAIQCGVRGPNYALSPFDNGGLQAIGEAARAVTRGEVDIAVAGATDAKVSVFGLTTYARVGYLAQAHDELPRPPFDVGRTGAIAGEGAAAFLVEDLAHASARGATVYAEIAGMGLAADSAPVGVPETADGFIAAMHAALADASITPSDVAAVHPAAGGHRRGDHVESVAILDAIGTHAQVFSSKHVFGDCFAAGGAVGVAAAIASLRTKVLYGPRDFGFDITCPVRQPDREGSELEGDTIVVNAGVLGGGYTSLVLRRPV